MASMDIHKLSVLTYNVWFSDFHFAQRVDSIFNLMCESGADIVCLQEVLPEFVRLVDANQKLKDTFPYISDLTGHKVRPYGVLMLSKFPYTNLTYVELETRMARKFLMAEFTFNKEKMVVGTVHLESLGTAPIRKKQIKTIHDTLHKKYRHWIVMGDFNFDSEINFGNAPGTIENEALKQMPDAIDTWAYLNSQDLSGGKTYDTEINKMLGEKKERMRYDRVMLYSQPTDKLKSTWEPVSAKLIGTEPIGDKLWPSDHFGVFVEFKYTPISDNKKSEDNTCSCM